MGLCTRAGRGSQGRGPLKGVAMPRGSRNTQLQGCGRSRFLDPGIRLALAMAAMGLFTLVNGRAGQAELYGSSFCGSRAVTKESNAHFKVRLAMSSKRLSPGATARIRLENPGAIDAAYGYPYQLQRYKKNSWVNLPVGPFFSAGLTVRSGSAGICQTLHIAKSSAPGVYRVSKSAWTATAKNERPKVVVRATFHVVAGDPRLGAISLSTQPW